MQPFHLDFAAPEYNPTDGPLATAPGFRLTPPEAGRIRCHVESADFPPIDMSNVIPPLADLWLWSVAVARGLLPVTVHIDEEGTEVLYVAEELPAERLRLSLIRREGRRFSFEPGRVIDAIAWTEERCAFLARWSVLWASYCQDDGLPWIEWEREGEQRFPEAMRDMPWEELADIPALEPPPWTRQQRIAWFYLSMAHQLRSRGHGCEYTADPDFWTLRELAFARLAIRAAQSAWAQVRTDVPPHAEALRLIQDAYELALDYPVASARDEQASRLALNHAHLEVMQATFGYIANIAEACQPHLPIGAGTFIADHAGRRAVILRAEGRDWLLYWDDGRITQEDAFHAGRHPSCRWPVATGPRFDRDRLDPIDARRLRFIELNASPVCVVCPVCGYPCMDDDVDDVQSCDICGYEDLWQLTFGRTPALDATMDERGDPISPTLRERRGFFLDHGDAWPAAHVETHDENVRVGHLRHPERRRMTRETMAEWDAWLENPDPNRMPEEVWRRWKRWEDEQRET